MTRTPTAGLLADAACLLPETVELRRRIHRHPEVGLQLPRTQAAVVDALAGLDLDVQTGTTSTSVTATIPGPPDGPMIVLRGDMDALVMPEESGVSYTSEIDGVMHSCGHDAHTAMLVAVGKLLLGRRDSLQGTVRLMFQPGEEGHHGARHMLDDGVLDDPPADAAFALHLTPNFPSGWLGLRGGPTLASADQFFVTIKGWGGHASTPHLANDPIPVACEIVQALQTYVTRRIDPFNPAVVTVGQVQAGTTTNVIPETATLSGTIRAVSESTRWRVHDGLRQVAEGVAAAHGMKTEIRLREGYPVTINDTGFTGFAAKVAADLIGDDKLIWMSHPAMGAEDFSYVLQRVPGAMAFLGACPRDLATGAAPACHSNRMRIDEDAMVPGIAIYAAVAMRFLAGELDLS